MNKEPMTEYGHNKLRDELKDLNKVQRPETVIELDIARSHGDLKENAEYHAAREKLRFIEGRIIDLGELLINSQLVDPSSYAHDRVRFGSTITLEDMQSEEEVTYVIVGKTESNPERGLISFHTPLARGLMGKGEGDEVEITLPVGKKEFEILSVEYKTIEFSDD